MYLNLAKKLYLSRRWEENDFIFAVTSSSIGLKIFIIDFGSYCI